MLVSRSRCWFRRLLVAGVALGVALGVIWLTVHHRPRWYRPADADEATIQRAQTESARVADDTSRNMVSRGGFEIQLSDRMVNEWLAALPALWPKAQGWLPPGARDPAVAFDDQEMRIGMYVDRNGWRVIANTSITARLSDDLTGLTISLHGVRGGSLPLPGNITRSLWRRMTARLDHQELRQLKILDLREDTQELTIRNRFVWPNGERPFRITRLGAAEGVLTIGIEPL